MTALERVGQFSLAQTSTAEVVHRLDRPLIEYRGESVARERLIWSDSNNPEDWVNEATDDLGRELRYQLVDRLARRVIDQEIEQARQKGAWRAEVDRVKDEARVRQIAAHEMAAEDRAAGRSKEPEGWVAL